MMFTIIVPLYNKALYVEKAIQSIISQTYKKWELIIVDDGSTDNSLEIAANCQLSIVNCQLIHQENQGVSVARNNGVKLAKYPYICFLDADDWWEPSYLEEMDGLIQKFPEAGIYSSGYYLVKNGHRRVAPIGIDATFRSGEINYLSTYSKSLCMPVWTGATIVKKELFFQVDGFNPNLKLGEDFDLWIRLTMKYPVVFLNKALSNYNQDVDVANRAIGSKLYDFQHHFLFSDYSKYRDNDDFVFLYERLELYGLLPYYISNKNRVEVLSILSRIRFERHSFKYLLYYKILPKRILKFYVNLLKFGAYYKGFILKKVIKCV